MAKKRNEVASLPVIEPNAAGIDVGATELTIQTAVRFETSHKPVSGQ